jgi:hypothetical protein
VYPLFGDGMLPDPFETLFDWAGIVAAHAYLATMHYLLNLAPYFLLAALLDRDSKILTPTALSALAASLGIFYIKIRWLPAALVVVATAAMSVMIYLAGRRIKDFVAARFDLSRTHGIRANLLPWESVASSTQGSRVGVLIYTAGKSLSLAAAEWLAPISEKFLAAILNKLLSGG